TKIDMMNTRQWNQLYAAISSDNQPFIFSEDSLNMNTDWQDEVYQKAPMRNIDVNTSGGTERITYSIGANYLTQKGLVKNTGYDKLLVSLNSATQITKRIKFDEVIRFAYDKTTGPAEWQYQNVYNNFTTMPTILMVPFLTPYDENGNWSVSPVGGNNPFVGIDARSNQHNKNVEIHGNFGLNIELVKGLTFTSRISATVNNYESWQFQPEYYSWSEDQNPLSRLDQNWRKDFSWTFQNYATYNKTFVDKHNFTFILGMEASNWWDYSISGYRLEFASSNPDLLYFDNALDNATAGQIIGGSGKEAKSQGYFGRLNYDFNNFLLAQFNYRRDGNSNFGPNNRWGDFYSGSAGFKFSELEVIKNLGFISFGKARIGYGETGQWPISTYWPYNSSILNTAQMDYSYDDATITTGLGPVQIPNPDLKWETVKTTNIGLDLGLMTNQLMLTVDYFNKVNDGMIMPQEVASVAGTYTVTGTNPGELGTTGITSTYPIVNYGSVSNKGIETTIEYKKQIGELRVNAGVNFTYQKNEITDLATDSTIQGSVHDLAGLTISKIGQPIGTYRGYQFDGIFREGDPMVYNSYSDRLVFADQPYQVDGEGDTIYALPFAEPGDARWVDANGDGQYNAEDYVYLGSYIPKFVFGFNIDLEYKGFDFSMFWQGVAGNKIFNGVKRWTYDWQTLTNHAAEFSDRYHLPIEYNGQVIDPGNLDSDLPDLGTANWGRPSSLYIENGSYLRLRILTLGYTLPKAWTSKVGIGRFRIYFTGKNLITFTKYTGYDPEVSNLDPKLGGIDVAGYPQSRMYTLGVNLEF
ncbi:MAG: SusC/RagA family TonB-linked outer membrane protein, partial [Bacteroidales bacterium]